MEPNRERLERTEEERVARAEQSTIPGMVSHVWSSTFYAEAMRVVTSQRKIR